MADPADNIADVEEHVEVHEPTAEDAEMDEYLAKFEVVESLKNEITYLKNELAGGRYDSEKVNTLVKFAGKTEQFISEVYNLLVDMNNVFGKN
jgi:hypothetical protein